MNRLTMFEHLDIVDENDKLKKEKEQLNTGKWSYDIEDKEIYFRYLGNKDKTNLGYFLHFDWTEPKEQTNEKRR